MITGAPSGTNRGSAATLACRPHRHIQRAERTVAGQFAEEHPALVGVHHLFRFGGIGAQPVDDALHGRFAGREHAPLAQDAADSDIFAPVLPRIANPHHAAVRRAQLARTLDLQEEEIDRIGSPADHRRPSVERPGHDLGPLEIGNEVAVCVHTAKRGAALARVAGLADQILRHAIDRHVETGRPIALRARPRSAVRNSRSGIRRRLRPALSRNSLRRNRVPRQRARPAPHRRPRANPRSGSGRWNRCGSATSGSFRRTS